MNASDEEIEPSADIYSARGSGLILAPDLRCPRCFGFPHFFCRGREGWDPTTPWCWASVRSCSVLPGGGKAYCLMGSVMGRFIVF